MDISVVFATYKNEKILEKSLQAYCEIETKYQWELIIVDNANSELTRNVIDKYKNQLPILFVDRSLPGKNNALNKALPLVKGKLIFFTDNDVLFSPNIIDVVVESSERYKEYDIFTGKILPDITLPDWIDFSSHRIRSSYVFSDRGSEDFKVLPEDVWGPSMVVRSEIFNNGISFNADVGPNGNSYIMGSETELLKRLQNAGYKAMYLAESKVLHQIRAEQLSIQWLKGRAYRSGRGASFNNDDDSVLFFGIPRYIIRKLIGNYFSLLYAVVVGNKKTKCLAYMEFNFNLGKLQQYSSNLK